MDVEIKKLSPALAGDYLDFFDNRAFTDHGEWSQCYCVHFHWERQWDDEPPVSSRVRAEEMLAAGKISGYLAYLDGKAAGWVNANDKGNYSSLFQREELWEGAEQAKNVKAVVCFLIAPEFRGRGIAAKLLERVCSDAAAGGYDYVEAYPLAGDADQYANHHGPYALYEKQGFVLHKKLAHDCIVRKYKEGYYGIS